MGIIRLDLNYRWSNFNGRALAKEQKGREKKKIDDSVWAPLLKNSLNQPKLLDVRWPA